MLYRRRLLQLLIILGLALCVCCSTDYVLNVKASTIKVSDQTKTISKKKEKKKLKHKAKKTYTKIRTSSKVVGKELCIKGEYLYTTTERVVTTRRFCHFKGRKYKMVYTTVSNERIVTKRKSTLMEKVDNRVTRAFNSLGFSIKKSKVLYAGKFDAMKRLITVRKMDNTIFHEMGHFLEFISAPDKNEWKEVYNEEKNSFSGLNKAYISQNESEFFAEAFRVYTMEPQKLLNECPRTYTCIQECLSNLTTDRVNSAKAIYGPLWNKK